MSDNLSTNYYLGFPLAFPSPGNNVDNCFRLPPDTLPEAGKPDFVYFMEILWFGLLKINMVRQSEWQKWILFQSWVRVFWGNWNPRIWKIQSCAVFGHERFLSVSVLGILWEWWKGLFCGLIICNCFTLSLQPKYRIKVYFPLTPSYTENSHKMMGVFSPASKMSFS